jgi:TIR domain
MSFQWDVFISYAHIDNEPLTPEQKGWVTLFHSTLQTMLSQQIGAKAGIWRDEKLRGNDIFSNEIVDQLPKTALMISVLTPRYVHSEWCTKEINEFCRIAQQTGGLVVDNKARVFKVIKTPIDREEPLPPVVNKVLGYEFYGYDEDQTPREFDPAYGEKSKEEFLRKVYKLARDIAQLRARLDASVPHDDSKLKDASAPKPMVYLAECSRDRRDARDVLRGELERYGYPVLPNQQLPSDEEEYVAEVERLVAQCRFSVHLIGTSYGVVPDGASQKSVVVLQNELAARRSKSGGLHRVIWLPEGASSGQAVQQAFIDALHQNAEMQSGADLITGDLEQLKGAIHAALKKLEQPEQPKITDQHLAEASRKLMYILCVERDRKEVVPLLKFLKGRELEVALPVFTGDATQVREANQELYVGCDGVILFYGAGDEAWKFHQQNELKKRRGQRDKPLLAEYTYLAGSSTDDKELLLTLEEPNLINGLNGFSEGAMDAFVRVVAPNTPAPR